jgi:hypothetical protein
MAVTISPHLSSGTPNTAQSCTAGVQRQRTTPEILSDLLRAEAAHRHAASIH